MNFAVLIYISRNVVKMPFYVQISVKKKHFSLKKKIIGYLFLFLGESYSLKIC